MGHRKKKKQRNQQNQAKKPENSLKNFLLPDRKEKGGDQRVDKAP